MAQRSRKKQELRTLLLDRKPGAFEAWIKAERNPGAIIQSLLYDSDPLVRWRAIEALGETAAAYAENDMEKVRLMVRNLFWLMNDESGGLVWNAPEAIGRILFRLPRLIGEYGKILSSFIHEEPFERGAHWALSTIVPLAPAVFEEVRQELVDALASPDPYIRGYSAVALARLTPGAVENQGAVLEDETVLRLYNFDSGGFVEVTVAALARQAGGLFANA